MTLEKRYTDDTDPLAEYTTDHTGDNPDEYLDVYLKTRDRANDGISEQTRYSYRKTWELWRRHMDESAPERPVVLPRRANVVAFIQRLEGGDAALQRPDTDDTDDDVDGLEVQSIHRHVGILAHMFTTLVRDGYLPSVANPAFDPGETGNSMIYNPFTAGADAESLTDRSKAARKNSGREYPAVSWDEIRDVLAEVTTYRDKAVPGLQLLLACRAGELSNMKLADIHIGYDRVHEYYPMGTSDGLRTNGYLHEHAVYIPADREGNKSKRDRIIPLTPEARRLMYAWLLVRPDAHDENGEPVPWLFLSKTRHAQLRPEAIAKIWAIYFGRFDPPAGSEKANVRSHFARHKATSYWYDNPEMTMRLLKYLRGDKITSEGPDSGGAVDSYLHANYRELEPIYRADPPNVLGG